MIVMSGRAPAVVWTLACLAGALLHGWTAGAQTRPPQAGALRVSHHARALVPGEVVRLSIGVPVTAELVEVVALGTRVRAYAGESEHLWEALVGIDLNARAGRHEVRVAARTADGVLEASYPLTVAAKTFPTRRLTVAPEFVEPPAEVGARIEREAARMAEIFRASTPRRIWNGPFVRPVPGEATSSFGRRSVFNGVPRSPHSGADFRAQSGTPVTAPNAGLVVLAEDLYFSGRTVVLDHGLGLYSLFAHLSEIGVAEGDQIASGHSIGRVGATGRVTGPHLHWSVRLAGARVDPLSLIAAASTD